MAAEPQELNEMKTILFTNLQILGMDVVDMEGTYKIQFNKDMFNLPNKAGSEVVLHFLFSKLNPSVCREQFRDCWPVLDRKTELQFRKVCTSWMALIQKDDAESHLPRVNAALLLSPGGRKFIHLLYSFSTYVLIQVMKSDHGWEAQYSIVYPAIPQHNEALGGVVSSAIQDSLIREKNQFFEHLHLTVIANRQWKDYANALVKEYRGLAKSICDLQLEKRQQVNILADNCAKQGLSLPAKQTVAMFDSDQDISAIKHGQRIEKAKSQWISLIKFCERMSENREIFQSILDNVTAKCTIDGTEMGICVPGLLWRECSEEMHKREIYNIYEGGALNLVSLVQLWNICLNMYKKHLESATLPSVSSEIPQISAQAHKHHSHLRHTQELREKMKNHTLPRLRRSIGKLQKKLNSQGVSAASMDKNTNRIGLVLTAPTPPLTTITRSSKSAGETPPGPIAGPVVHGNTPDALHIVNSKIEMAINKDEEASQMLKDVPALTRLMKIQQGSVTRRGTNVPIVKSNVKKDHHMKSTKLQDKMKVLPSKNSIPAGLATSNSSRNAALNQTTQTNQNAGKSMSTFSSLTTPRTSKQTAFDILADNIVDSVLNSSDSAVLPEMNIDTFLEFGDLDTEAFETKNLISRSPVKSSTSQNSQNQQSFGHARPKAFSAHKTKIDGFHNQGYSYSEKTPEVSVHYESVFSQNSMDADSSFNSGSAEFDWSNNAAIGEVSQHLEAYRSRNGKQNNESSFNESSKDLYSTDSLSKITTGTISSDVGTQAVDHGTTSPYKTPPRSSKKKSNDGHKYVLSPELFSNDLHILNSLDTLDKLSVTHFENGHEQRLQSPNISHSLVREDLIHNSSNLEKTNHSPGLFFKLTKTPQSTQHSPSSRSQSRLAVKKTSYDGTQKIKNLYEKETSTDFQNMPDRQPGDGQASSDQTVQPVSAVFGNSDSDTDAESVLDLSKLNSRSLFKPEMDLSSASDLLTTPIHRRLNKVPNCELSVPSCGQSDLHTKVDMSREADVELQSLQELHLVSDSNKKPFSIENLINDHSIHETSTSSIADILQASEDKLLDFETKNVPVLVGLDSEDEDMDSEQSLDDSYIPLKEGIHLDSRSPARNNFKSSTDTFQPLSRANDSQQAVKAVQVSASSEDSLQIKLDLLRKKALDILGSSIDDGEAIEEPSPTKHESMKNIAIPSSLNKEDALFSANTDDDDDILSTEILNTDLVADTGDLVSL